MLSTIFKSLYCFSIPFQFTNNLSKTKIRSPTITQSNYNKNLWFDLLPEKESHLHRLKLRSKELRKTILNEENYHALSFRPSSYKMDPVLQFVPLKYASTHHSNFLNFSYYHTTFGAPAAHYYKLVFSFLVLFFFGTNF